MYGIQSGFSVPDLLNIHCDIRDVMGYEVISFLTAFRACLFHGRHYESEIRKYNLGIIGNKKIITLRKETKS